MTTLSEALGDATDLFSSTPVEDNILSGRTVVYRSTSDNENGPFIYNLDSLGPNQYMKLDSLRLNGICKVTRADGSPLTKEDDVSIVNMFPSSLFQGTSVYLNNVLITELTNFHAHYQSYIETTINFNTNAQQTHLQGQLYVPDQAERFDNLTSYPDKAKMIEYFKKKSDGSDANRYQDSHLLRQVLNSSYSTDELETDNVYHKVIEELSDKYLINERLNRGFVERRRIIADSQKFDFYIPITNDFFQSDKLLHSSVDLKLVLTRAPDSFSMLSYNNQTQYKIHIVDLKLFARYLTLSDNIVDKHQKLFSSNPLIYPVKKTTIKSYQMSISETSKYITNMFSGVLPKSILVTCVDSDAFHGSQSKNPYNFIHNNLRGFSLRVNGEAVPAEPIAPNFKDDLFMREYMDMYRNCGIDVSEDSGNIITPALYKGGMFFISADLTGDQNNMLRRVKKEEGNIDAEIIFDAPLTFAVTLLVLANFDIEVEIHQKTGPQVKYY